MESCLLNAVEPVLPEKAKRKIINKEYQLMNVIKTFHHFVQECDESADVVNYVNLSYNQRRIANFVERK